MDPKACLSHLINSITYDDNEGYLGCKEDLINWFRNGGFCVDVVYCFSPFARSLKPSADGRKGKLVSMTHTGDAVIRWGNGRKSTVRLSEIGLDE